MSDAVRLHDDLTSADSAKILKGAEFEVLSRARAGVDSAEQEAADIVAQAHADAEQIRNEAHEASKQEAARLLAQHTVLMTRDLDAIEPRLTTIVSTALKRVLDPFPPEKLILAAVRHAIAEIDMSRGATLVMAPELLPKVRDQLKRFSLGDETLTLSGDPSCPADSTILRTPYGDIELNVDAQLVALSEGIEAALAGTES